MADPFVAEIRIFPFNFAPTGWAWCDGQLLPISQNTALFSLLGTNYGGDGKSNFALPDLQTRAPLQQGQGPGLSPYVLREPTGTETVTLLQTELPMHQHTFMVTSAAGTTESAPGNQPGVGGSGQKGQSYSANLYSPPPNKASTSLSPAAIGPTGGQLPHN